MTATHERPEFIGGPCDGGRVTAAVAERPAHVAEDPLVGDKRRVRGSFTYLKGTDGHFRFEVQTA